MASNNLEPSNTISPKTPNDVLASIICARLKDEGLIHDRHQNDLLNRLKHGGVSQDDWRVWIELAIEGNSKQEKAVN